LPHVSFPLWTTLALALVLGLRHALEPDHVAAVSTFATHERNPLRSSLLGAYWGMGHTAALVVFGMVIAMLRLEVTPRLSNALDFAVGLMLIALGVNVMLGLNRQGFRVHVHTHEHDGQRHSHLHFHLGSEGHAHDHRLLRVAGKPFMVGVVHGLAGTGAVMLMVVTAIPSLLIAVGYLVTFGVGAIGGMMAMSLLMSLPGALAAKRTMAVERAVRFGAGAFSLGFGLFLAWSVGLIQSFAT
jgi:ABC-type nickel/cobalt efflux system permease component RcnA